MTSGKDAKWGACTKQPNLSCPLTPPPQALIAMGFHEKDAAIALFRTWENPDEAAALLLSEGQVEGRQHDEANHPKHVQNVDDSEDEDLARAVALSLQGGSDATDDSSTAQTDSRPFEYGRDYPKPIIQPVSLMHTEQAEEEARQQQSKRDDQIAAAKRHKGSSGQAFRKPAWEHARQQWPAETPTGAKMARAQKEPNWQGAGYGSWQRRSRNFEQAEPEAKDSGSVSGRRWGGRAMGG